MRTTLTILLLLIASLQTVRAGEQQAVYGKTLDDWIRVFRDKGSTKADRQRAVWALGCFDADARAVVPDLIVEVGRGQRNHVGAFDTKASAVDLLVRIGEGTEVTVPYLIDCFLKEGCLRLTGTGSIGYSSSVRDNLARIGGPAVPALLNILKGPDRDMRVCAAQVLGDIGPAARAAIPPLIRAIEHPEDDRKARILCHHAALALGRIGPEANAAAPALIALLDKRDGSGFDGGIGDFELVMALDGIGVPPVRKLLDSLLCEGDPTGASTMALAWLGPKAREATPELRGALTDKRPQVRISAAVVLAYIELSAQDAIPVLIEALKHRGEESFYQRDVPKALAHLGPQAKAALPELIGIVQAGIAEPDTLEALVQIDPEGKECVPALITGLKSHDVETVHVAANCLSLLGPRAEEAIPALAETLTRDDNFDQDFFNSFHPQVSAAHALRRMGPQAKTAIPTLIRALKYRRIVRPRFADDVEERDCSVAAASAQVLGSFRADAKDAVSALIEAAQTREQDHANWPLREAAILALGQIGPDAKAAIPVLRSLMKEEGKDSPYMPQLVAGLFQLTQDGKELAEAWLAKQVIDIGDGNSTV